MDRLHDAARRPWGTTSERGTYSMCGRGAPSGEAAGRAACGRPGTRSDASDGTRDGATATAGGPTTSSEAQTSSAEKVRFMPSRMP